MVAVNDLAGRPPRPLEDGDVIDLGAKRIRYLATPHVPHGVGGWPPLRRNHLHAAVR